MRLDTYFKSGGRINKLPLLADTWGKKEFSQSRVLSDEKIKELKSQFSGDYERDLRILFTLDNDLNLSTLVEHTQEEDFFDIEKLTELRSRPNYLPKARKEAFDLTPNPNDVYQCKVYNELVHELLSKENNNQHWYNCLDQHIQRIIAKIENGPSNKESVVKEEIRTIESYFPFSEKVSTWPDEGFDFPYDNPFSYVATDPSAEIELIGNLFTYLYGNKTIYFGQFINWWHHIQILNVKEVIEYYNWLKAGGNTQMKTRTQVTELKELFLNEAGFQKAIAALTSVKPPIISDNEYIGGERGKGAITAWYTAAKEKGLFKNGVQPKHVAKVINNTIIGLNLGAHGRSLSGTNTSACIKYINQFRALLS